MRLLPVALAGGVLSMGSSQLLADSVWNPLNFNWNTGTNWTPNGVPGGGAIADIFKATSCTYNYNGSSVKLAAVQVAAGGTFQFTTASSSGDVLEVGSLAIGGTNTGAAGGNTCTGAGTVTQQAGTVEVDSGGSLAVDAASSYALSASGNIYSSSNEQLAGIFSQSGGFNDVSGGSSLTNSGLYSINNTSGGLLNSDSIVNSGTFNQSGATLEGTTTGAGGTFSFTNSGAFNYTLGNFDGVMNNSGIVTVSGQPIPFFRGIVNNGLLTVNASTGTFAGAISGGGANSLVIFKGANNVTLTGSNTYTGSTSITGGTVVLACPVGTAANNYGGAFQGNVTISSNAILQLNASSQICNTSTQVLTINGGTLNLNGFDDTIGNLVMNGGTIQQSDSTLGLGITTGLVTIGNSTSTINGGLRSASPYDFVIATGGIATVVGPIGNYNTSGSQALLLEGGGSLDFSGLSRLSSIDVRNGILQVSEGGTLGNVNTLLTLEAAGSISLNNQSLTVGDLSGNPGGAVALGSGTLTVTSSVAGSSFPGTINGTGSIIKTGTGTLTITGPDISTGTTTVSAGTLTMTTTSNFSSAAVNVAALATLNFQGRLSSTPNITTTGTVNITPITGSGITQYPVGSISIAGVQGVGNGQVNIAAASPHANRILLQASSLTFGGVPGALVGQLDLSNNDMVIHNGSLADVQNQILSGFDGGDWQGQGIVSSAAATDPSHLTTLAVISNDLGGGTPLFGLAGTMGKLFDNYNAYPTDILIKYTYYGDANLDGQVDGTDYSRIDNGYLSHSTGWLNGDFNYDNTIDGSDYTLIDNAFNTQGVNLTSSAEVAVPTVQIAGASAVPEPGTIALLAVAASALLLQRRPRPAIT